MSDSHEPGALLAVIPAAGSGRRLGRLPCSKEILPLPGPEGSGKPITTCIELALGRLRECGLRDVLVIVGRHKADIPRYLGTGEHLGLRIRYRHCGETRSSPETLATAAHEMADRRVLLIYADILWGPGRSLADLLTQAHAGSDFAMLTVPVRDGRKVDIVEARKDGRVRALHIKPADGRAGETWVAGLWSPAFSNLLTTSTNRLSRASAREIHVGDLVREALREGLSITRSHAPDGWALDTGTPDDLRRALLGTWHARPW